MIWDNGRKKRKEWAFLKHQIENLVFKEIVWARPYKTEAVWEVTLAFSGIIAIIATGSRYLGSTQPKWHSKLPHRSRHKVHQKY